jgi:hypothetical protein
VFSEALQFAHPASPSPRDLLTPAAQFFERLASPQDAEIDPNVSWPPGITALGGEQFSQCIERRHPDDIPRGLICFCKIQRQTRHPWESPPALLSDLPSVSSSPGVGFSMLLK